MGIKAERVASQIQRELADIIRTEVKDHKIGFITITAVEITNDKEFAKVYYTVLGSDDRTDAAQKALDRAKGFIKGELGRRLQIRKAPQLTFILDSSTDYGNKIEKILKNLNDENKM